MRGPRPRGQSNAAGPNRSRDRPRHSAATARTRLGPGAGVPLHGPVR